MASTTWTPSAAFPAAVDPSGPRPTTLDTIVTPSVSRTVMPLPPWWPTVLPETVTFALRDASGSDDVTRTPSSAAPAAEPSGRKPIVLPRTARSVTSSARTPEKPPPAIRLPSTACPVPVRKTPLRTLPSRAWAVVTPTQLSPTVWFVP